jgi:DNA-binding GntR family transcriptional regulator
MQIADDLARKISSGKYAPGDKLPSHKALAEEYKTAPGTAASALRVLADLGIVQAHAKLGTFVRRPPEPGEVREPSNKELARQLAELRAEVRDLEAKIMELWPNVFGEDYGGKEEGRTDEQAG